MYLIIDASALKTLVALGDRTKIVSSREWVAGVKLSQELLPAIAKILARRPKPSAIFCVTGPGSFTGLRIAVSTANALGYAWQIPIVPVEAFEIYEAAQKNLKAPSTVVLDNIKDLVYVKRVKGRQVEYSVDSVEKFKLKNVKCHRSKRDPAKGGGKIIGFLPAEKKTRLCHGGGKLDDSLLPIDISNVARARIVLAIGKKATASSKIKTFSRPLTPLYINPPRISFKNNF